MLVCEALDSTKEAPVIETFVRLFRERGLPDAIRSDNGLDTLLDERAGLSRKI